MRKRKRWRSGNIILVRGSCSAWLCPTI